MHSPVNIIGKGARGGLEAGQVSSIILKIVLSTPFIAAAGHWTYRVYQGAEAKITDGGIGQAIGYVRGHFVRTLWLYFMVHYFSQLLPSPVALAAQNLVEVLCICMLGLHFDFVVRKKTMALQGVALLLTTLLPAYVAHFISKSSVKILGLEVDEHGTYFCVTYITLFFFAWCVHGREFAKDQANTQGVPVPEASVCCAADVPYR